MSLYQKTMSSAVNGSPSDHLCPLRSVKVISVKSSFHLKSFAMLGTMVFSSSRKRSKFTWRTLKNSELPDSGPIEAKRARPPYLPISSEGTTTSGSSGRRCSTGARSPLIKPISFSFGSNCARLVSVNLQFAAASNSASSYCWGHLPAGTPCILATVMGGHPPLAEGAWVAAEGAWVAAAGCVAATAWVAAGGADWGGAGGAEVAHAASAIMRTSRIPSLSDQRG